MNVSAARINVLTPGKFDRNIFNVIELKIDDCIVKRFRSLNKNDEEFLLGKSEGDIYNSILQKVDEIIVKRLDIISATEKSNAVFLLYFNGQAVGTGFAIHKLYILTARHIIYDDCQNFSSADTRTIKVGNSDFSLRIESCLNPIEGQPDPNKDDWIILKRIDCGFFHPIIQVTPRYASVLFEDRPRITIYHHPMNFQTSENNTATSSHSLKSTHNRVIGANNGELHCNDLSVISKGSCGGPYIDTSCSTAIGFHLGGASFYEGTANKLMNEAINQRTKEITNINVVDYKSVSL